MKINTLVCEKRDLALKAKKIRNNGYVPAVVFGRHIDSLSIQIKQNTAMKLSKTSSIGSRVILDIDGEEQLAIIKEFQRDPASRRLLHIDFHALTSGEKVKVTLPINYMNRDSVDQGTILHEHMSEIDISTLPQYLVDYVSVDVSKYSLGDSVYVSDLDISNDENIEVISPQDSLVCAITYIAQEEEEEPEEEEETEVEVISDRTEEEAEEE